MPTESRPTVARFIVRTDCRRGVSSPPSMRRRCPVEPGASGSVADSLVQPGAGALARRCCRPQHRADRRAFAGRLGRQPVEALTALHRHRDAIPIDDPRPRCAGDPLSRQHRAGEARRVAGTDADPLRAGRRLATLAPKLRQGLGQGELLAGQAGDEAAAPDLAARFQALQDADEAPPGGQPTRLALEQAPADDAVAAQQRPGDVFDGVGVSVGVCSGVGSGGRPIPASPDQGPAPGILDTGPGRSATPVSASTGWRPRRPANARRSARC